MISLGKALKFLKSGYNRLIKNYERTLFKEIGQAVHIGNHCVFTFGTISLGDHVHVGNFCVFQSAHGEIRIGNHVLFGPGVHIHGGNHAYDKVGVFIDENDAKVLGQDGVVRIEDDVWVGANAMILQGVTLGRGCIVGAGSIVTRDVPAYAIVAGNPAHILKYRFQPDEIARHESILYPITQPDDHDD